MLTNCYQLALSHLCISFPFLPHPLFCSCHFLFSDSLYTFSLSFTCMASACCLFSGKKTPTKPLHKQLSPIFFSLYFHSISLVEMCIFFSLFLFPPFFTTNWCNVVFYVLSLCYVFSLWYLKYIIECFKNIYLLCEQRVYVLWLYLNAQNLCLRHGKCWNLFFFYCWIALMGIWKWCNSH